MRTRIGISSNGVAMTPYLVEKLLRSPLHEICFSLDAASSDTYRDIRDSDFTRTIRNIRHLVQRRNALKKADPQIMLNMTLMRRNIDDLPGFIELAASLGADAVQFWPLHDYNDVNADNWTVERNGWVFKYREQMLGHSPEEADDVNKKIDHAVELAEKSGVRIIWPMGGKTHITLISGEKNAQEALAAPADVPPATTPRSTGQIDCVAPWEWMLVDVQGDVRPCCYVRNTFGNIHDKRPEDIWNGPEYRAMRASLAQGKLPAVCRDAACKYARGNWIYQQPGA